MAKNRILEIYERLNRNEAVNVAALAEQYEVSTKTIKRDITDIREFIADRYGASVDDCVPYDKKRNAYYLKSVAREWLSKEEVLATAKILLESRAFCKDELNPLMDKLLMQVAPADRKLVEDVIRNEYFYYIQLQHGRELLSPIWQLSEHIAETEVIQFLYARQDGTVKKHEVKPVAVMFSEFYFYLIGYLTDGRKGDSITTYYEDFDDVLNDFKSLGFYGDNLEDLNKYLDKFNLTVHEFSEE